MNPQEDRLAEYTSVSAGHAANAIARLLDRTVVIDPPRCWRMAEGEPASSLFPPEERVAAVFADLDGALGGQAGLMFSQNASEELLSRLAGSQGEDELDEREASVLRELGNIAISAAAGALGELQGGVVLPSVPRLAYEPEGALPLEEGCVEPLTRPHYLFETELVERDGPLRIRFVWVPSRADFP